MKRILHVVGQMDRAGAETMIMNLYRTIDKTQFQFDFLYFTNRNCDYDDEIRNLGGKIYRIVTNNPILRMKETIRLLRQQPQWEVLHCHTLFSNAFHIYAAYKAKIPERISHSHNTQDSPSSKNSIIVWIYHYLSRIIQSKYSTRFVACGIAAGKYLFPKKGSDVVIFPNSIDLQMFVDVAEKEQDYLRREFGLNKNTLVLLQLGRLEEVKNHRFSIAIAQSLKNMEVDFRLFFVGQGSLKEPLLRTIESVKLEKEIILLGVRSDIPKILAGTDVLLMPSFFEGFPVVLVESQAAGIPALIANTISLEVDLGVQLIYLESLNNSSEVWSKQIFEIISQNKITAEERLKILKKQGFDIRTNCDRLEILYS